MDFVQRSEIQWDMISLREGFSITRWPDVFRLPRNQLQRVRQQIDHCLQRFHSSRRTPRQIQNQSRPANSANRATQRRKSGFPHSLGSHLLGDPFNQPVAHRTRSFGRHIARSDPSASRRDDQTRRRAQLNKFSLNDAALVGNQRAPNNPKPAPLQTFRHRRSGEIHFLAARTRVADRNHRSSHSLSSHRPISCRAGHLRPQCRPRQPPQPRRAALRRADASPPSAGLACSRSLSLCPCSFQNRSGSFRPSSGAL